MRHSTRLGSAWICTNSTDECVDKADQLYDGPVFLCVYSFASRTSSRQLNVLELKVESRVGEWGKEGSLCWIQEAQVRGARNGLAAMANATEQATTMKMPLETDEQEIAPAQCSHFNDLVFILVVAVNFVVVLPSC